MRILSARIFLSLLAGKLNNFNQMFEETTMTSEQRIFFSPDYSILSFDYSWQT